MTKIRFDLENLDMHKFTATDLLRKKNQNQEQRSLRQIRYDILQVLKLMHLRYFISDNDMIRFQETIRKIKEQMIEQTQQL